ncbi:APC family permease [Salinisphaera sp.]|uniref:APC family permease n=1 Tax=Salinisphaera sp. TaxID=1914330 RepID=UPI000C4DECFA|nr:APC family permease [Salinisphaera sp.]MBS62691.1 amino acid transporter [Salinisphaera sp.]
MTDLNKSLGLFGLIAMGAAGVLGTSWIYTNGEFFAAYGAGGEIFGLIIGAVLAACVASAYAELASRYPRAGGEIVYAFVAFGRPTAFVAGWLLIGAYVSSLAFYVAAAGGLLARVFPAIDSGALYTLAGETVHAPVLIIGAVLAIAVYAINRRGLKVGGGVQVLLFAAMLLIGLGLTVVGFAHGERANFWPAYAADGRPIADTLRFVLPAMTFLTGFSLVGMLAEDARLSPRRIGIAVVITVLLAGTFYVVVLTASAWIIPWQRTAELEQGTIDAYRIAGFPVLAWGAYVIALLGLLTSFIALFVASSRVMLALARAGIFPPVFARVDPHRGTPDTALLFTLNLVLALGWLGEAALTWFLDTGGIYIGLAWLLAVASLYRIRARQPDAEAPYRVRWLMLPVIGALAATAIILATLLPGTGMSLLWPHEYLILLGWLVLGVVIYGLAPPAMSRDQALTALLGTGQTNAASPPTGKESAQ